MRRARVAESARSRRGRDAATSSFARVGSRAASAAVCDAMRDSSAAPTHLDARDR